MKRFKDYFAMPVNERINFRAKYPYYEYMIGSKANKKGILGQISTKVKILQMLALGKLSETSAMQMLSKESKFTYFNF